MNILPGSALSNSGKYRIKNSIGVLHLPSIDGMGMGR